MWKRDKETFRQYLDRKLAEIPRDMVVKAVEVLRKEIGPEVQQQIKVLHEKDPENWWGPYHFHWGMGVRNTLREHGLSDDLLPDKNWDDYYIQIVEIVVGIRPMPK